jgi:hypothetical protein
MKFPKSRDVLRSRCSSVRVPAKSAEHIARSVDRLGLGPGSGVAYRGRQKTHTIHTAHLFYGTRSSSHYTPTQIDWTSVRVPAKSAEHIARSVDRLGLGPGSGYVIPGPRLIFGIASIFFCYKGVV